LYQAGNVLARIIAYEVRTNVILACAQDAQTYADCRVEHALYVNTFLQTVAAQLQEHSLCDGLKEATTIGIETWLTGKGIHVLSKWISRAATYTAALAKRMQKGEAIAVAVAGEDIAAQITTQAAESLVNAMEQAGGNAVELEKILEANKFLSFAEELSELQKLFDGVYTWNGQKLFFDFQHIFEGIIYENGKFGGLHHDLMRTLINIGKVRIIKELPNGAYLAEVSHNGKWIKKSFFPSHWSRRKVVQSIVEVLNDEKSIIEQQGSYKAIEGIIENIKTLVVVDEKGMVITAYPIIK
jgi:hypothetical protein